MNFKFYPRVDEEIAIGAIGAIDLLTDSGVQAKIDGKTKRQPQKYANFPDGTARCFFIHLKR